jgi:hypothetical protein
MAMPPTFGQSFSSALGSSLGSSVVGMLPSSQTTTGTSSGTQTQQLDLSPEGYNKIIKDILSSDAGLAALATGENLSGGYGSSVKAQLAQDLVLNIAGEMAKLTAPSVSTTQTSSKSKTKKKTSVICTELERQGLLDPDLYDAGHAHFLSLPDETVAGYRIWAEKVVPLMQKSAALSRFLQPIAVSRYQMIVHKRFGILGAITIYIGQPICFVIGKILAAMDEGKDNGDVSSAS